jgi:anti-anti-sigma regulatory factor
MVKAPKNQVTLPAVVDLDAVDGVRDGLLAAIERGPVVVSAAAVERVSTNALIMLLSAAETARRSNFEFSIVGANAAITSAIDRLGFEPSFADMLKG